MEPTTKLVDFKSLEALAIFGDGRIGQQYTAAVEEMEAIARDLDNFKTKDGAAPFKIVITLSGTASPDGFDLEANVELKGPKPKAIRDAARVRAGRLTLVQEMMTQEVIPGLRNIK